MNKDEALKYIENSTDKEFKITSYTRPKKVCDLCKKPSDREFYIQAKHIGNTNKSTYIFNNAGIRRITKHICTDCFVKLFPDSVLDNKIDNTPTELDNFINKMQDMVTEIDKWMCTKSTLREGEIYDIQQFFKKYGFNYDENSMTCKFIGDK
jgi:preprotein translocase subunit Sss1